MPETASTTTLDEYTAARLASLFGALADPTRLRILAALLEGEVNVGELAQRLDRWLSGPRDYLLVARKPVSS